MKLCVRCSVRNLLILGLSVCVAVVTGCPAPRVDQTPPEPDEELIRVLETTFKAYSGKMFGELGPVGQEAYEFVDRGRKFLRDRERLGRDGVPVSALAEFDVLVVADSHYLDLCRESLRLLLGELVAAGLDVQYGVVLEALSASHQTEIGSSASTPNEILRLTRLGWPYPVASYRGTLELIASRSELSLLGGGLERDRSFEMRSRPDMHRAPPLVPSRQVGLEFFRETNESIVNVVLRWCESGRKSARRVAVVFVGKAHVMGWEGNLAPLLSAQGLRVAFLVPFIREWEIELRRKQGDRDTPLQVLANVFYLPYATRSGGFTLEAQRGGPGWPPQASCS